jgi:predicted RNA-binding protein Jag
MTREQIESQRIAANAARAANSATDTGFWKGSMIQGRQGQVLGNPAEILGAGVGARPELNPANNPFLMQGGMNALRGASGDLQKAMGARATDFGNTSAFAAGKIGQAGEGARNLQTGTLATAGGQAAQSQRDLGIVRNSATGQGPSAAENLARSQMDASIRAQAAQAGAARGGNLAAAQRAAAQAGSDTRLQSTAQLAAQRAQEQLNAQQLLTSGNTAVGNQFQGLGGQYGNVRGADIGQATAAASSMNDAARTAAAQYGIDAQVYGSGVQGALQGGQQFGNQMLGQQQFEQQNSKDYTNWLQNQFSLAMGIPVQYGAQQTQQNIANQQAQTQQQGALIGAGGAILGALL